MPKSIKDLRDRAAEMVRNDRNLRVRDEDMDRMVNLEWELPSALDKSDWVRQYTSSAPFEIVQAGTRTLSAVMPRLQIDPITVKKMLKGKETLESKKARKYANGWEKALLKALNFADARQGSLIADMTRSAFKYDRIAFQVIYLPYQMKSVEAAGGNAKRYEALRRQGDFAIKIHHPKDVHVRYSAYGTEEILLTTVMGRNEIIDLFGNKADALRKRRDTDDSCPEDWILCDYTDYQTRAVWCFPGDNVDKIHEAVGEERQKLETDTITILAPEEPKFPFLNGWVCVKGGTALDRVEEHQYLPLLYAAFQSGQWENINVVGTLLHSMAIAEAGKAKVKVTGPNPQNIESDMTEPGGRWNVPTGHDVQDMRQDLLDPALSALFASDTNDMNAAAVAKVLVTSDTTPGETFSGFDMRAKMAIGSLMPWKKLSERAITEMFKVMLLWIHYSGEDLNTYGKGDGKTYEQYTIKAEDIHPECIYLDAELVTDMPIDRQQQVNTAAMMSEKLQYSRRKIMEFLGETDPEGALEEYLREQLSLAAFEGKKQLVLKQSSGELKEMAMQMAQEIVAQQAQQAGISGATPPTNGNSPNAPQGLEGLPPEVAGAMGGSTQDLGGGMGMPGVGGEGFNAATGGQQPAGVNPMANTREGATGKTRRQQ